VNYYVYILYSPGTNTFYKGQTNNVFERLERHNAGREKFTAKGKPWTLLWFTRKNSRAQAINLERKLKNLSRKRLVEFMLKYREDIAGSDALIFLNQWSEC
jgi:putative endonuclease